MNLKKLFVILLMSCVFNLSSGFPLPMGYGNDSESVIVNLACCANCLAEEPYQSYKSESIVDEFKIETPQGAFKHVVEIYPKEIYWGDPVYVVSYCENVSDQDVDPFSNGNTFDPNEVLYLSAYATFDKNPKKYHWNLDRPFSRPFFSMSEYRPRRSVLKKEQKVLGRFGVCEFPPLEDLQTPFWQNLKKELTSNDVVCSFVFYARYCVPSEDGKRIDRLGRDVVAEITIKPRPENETALLDKWYADTPKELLPVKRSIMRELPLEIQSKRLNNTFDLNEFGEARSEENDGVGNVEQNKSDSSFANKKRNDDVKKYDESLPSGISDIEISGRKYSPWNFIRFGNRKPCIPNNPTTLEGWRELEASLSPSVMRDEIHFTRLLLEYYSAETADRTEVTKKEICDWLKSLPRAQRLVLCPSKWLDGGRIGFSSKDPLAEKREKLLQAIKAEHVEFEFDRTF